MDSISLHGSRAAPSMSLIDNKPGSNTGVGNYKGVMLCNRPFAGSVAGAPKGGDGSGSDKNAFSCGVVPQTLGTTHVRRPKKENAISRHRKWLADLQKTKEKLEAEYTEEADRKRESQEKFAAREAKLRQNIREVKITAETNEWAGLSSQAKDIDYAVEGSLVREAKTGSTSRARKQKPAWALTEDKAQAKGLDDDDELAADEADLLAFASGLDYDRYIADVEVRTMMERVRRRISELEREIAQDEKLEVESAQRSSKRQTLEQEGEEEEGEEEEWEGDETLRAAKELLQKRAPGLGLDLRSVHSAQSTAALVRASSSAAAKEKEDTPKVTNEPLVVKYEQTEGSRLELKNDISKLPYMHRNPAL